MMLTTAASRLLSSSCQRVLRHKISGNRSTRIVLSDGGVPTIAAPLLVVVQSRVFSDASEGPKKKQVKVKKKEKSKSAETESHNTKILKSIFACLDAPTRKEPPISDEEKARRHELGRNYVIGRFKQHNEIYHDLMCKIQMKKHAIKMLPRNSKLKEEALKISEEMPPLSRIIPGVEAYRKSRNLEPKE